MPSERTLVVQSEVGEGRRSVVDEDRKGQGRRKRWSQVILG